SCSATASERIPRSIDNYVTGVSESSQQSSNLKDEGYNHNTNSCSAFPVYLKVHLKIVFLMNFLCFCLTPISKK
ncbi:hypothetical protein, partial [Photorhabdus sp. RM125S]|uniref:hypothetical protein n=1 Tax=Photorhabdus sp. RM125S TaxID=3342821 RepID=UPI0036DDB250